MAVQIIVMGVSGCGKSTLGRALAQKWGVPFIEGDLLHAPESVAKMAAGVALDDTDRWPWLDRIGAALAGEPTNPGSGVASCSALRRTYRDRLRQTIGPDLRFLMIDLPKQVLEQRLSARTGHYMPPALLDSQLRTLERPTSEADVLVLHGTAPMSEMVLDADRWCRSFVATA